MEKDPIPDYLKYPADELLDEFGAGNHKPGSGCAAAFQGMISAQLIRTVISLTLNSKSPIYKENISKFRVIVADIDSRIIPQLKKLFQEDLLQFSKYIELCRAKRNEQDKLLRKQLNKESLKELKPATEIPIAIGKLCSDLAKMAGFVFDNGYKEARGDSGVALNGSIAAIAGCISIIDLNLLSFESTNSWTAMILRQAETLREEHKNELRYAELRLSTLQKEMELNFSYREEIKSIQLELPKEQDLTYEKIEHIARRLQNALWLYRKVIWKTNTPDNPIDVLDINKALSALGYAIKRLKQVEYFQDRGVTMEVAGFTDNVNKIVAIAPNLPLHLKNFTEAHELGHALFHKQEVLHRDLVYNGSLSNDDKSLKEKQADKFATYFLMPEKHVRKVFYELFGSEKWVLNEDTVFALTGERTEVFKRKCRNLDELSQIIAAAERYSGKNFNSIAKIFKVSVEAMAIRLKELDLIEFVEL